MDTATEKLHASAKGIDDKPLCEVASLLLDNQIIAAQCVRQSLPTIEAGARLMAHTLQLGGRLVYAAAGSSALMALADALELGGTFGIPSDKVRILMAGGIPTNAQMPGDTEDDVTPLAASLDDLTAKDTLIALSASGSTPYTLEAARIANHKGTRVIGIANNPDSPLASISDCAIYLATPPEVVSGSTRMGAGTAQKLTLNTMSTLMAIELGHVHDGMMVNLIADNTKLRMRASGMVQSITHVSEDAARAALATTDGNVKTATLLCAGIGTRDEAEQLLQQSGGRLRPALARVQSTNE